VFEDFVLCKLHATVLKQIIC